MQYFAGAEIAALVGVSLRVVQKRMPQFQGGRKRAKGKGLEYPIWGLPQDYREKLAQQGIVEDFDAITDLHDSDPVVPGGTGDGDGCPGVRESVGGTLDGEFGAGDVDRLGVATPVAAADRGEVSPGGFVAPSNCGSDDLDDVLRPIDFADDELGDDRPGVWGGMDDLGSSGAAETPIEFDPGSNLSQRRADAKIVICAAWRALLIRSDALNRGLTQQLTLEFCDRYRDRSAGLPMWVYEAQRGISYQSLYRWDKAKGVADLRRKKSPRGRTVSPEQGEAIKSLLLNCPHLSVTAIWREVSDRFEDCPSIATVRRFVTDWISHNRGAYQYALSPKTHRSNRMRAFGNRGVDSYNARWELDSTRADIVWELLGGGHFQRFHLVAAIEVYSRMAKVLVCRTSNSLAIGALTRECLLDWGVPQVVKTDNGKDYVSRHIVGILKVLGIEHQMCAPFSPQQKPFVERFIGTMNHGSAMLLHPRYLGHDVMSREKIRARELWKENPAGVGDSEIEIVRVNKSLREMQSYVNAWVNEYHNTPHSGLPKIRDAEGKSRHMTPLERAANQPVRVIEDVRALDVLMLPAAQNGGYRSARRKEGIQIGLLPNGLPAFYWGECLVAAAERFDRVFVRCDSALGVAHIFDSEDCTEHLGQIECYELTGNNPMPGIVKVRAAEKEQRQAVRQARKSAQRLVSADGDNVVLLPGQSRVHHSPALDAVQPEPVAERGLSADQLEARNAELIQEAAAYVAGPEEVRRKGESSRDCWVRLVLQPESRRGDWEGWMLDYAAANPGCLDVLGEELLESVPDHLKAQLIEREASSF